MFTRKIIALLICISFICSLQAQHYTWEQLKKLPSVLHEEAGVDKYNIDPFIFEMGNYSQLAMGLSPVANSSFDFTPSKRIKDRRISGMNYLGDINVQFRLLSDTSWTTYYSATQRLGNKVVVSNQGNTLSKSILVLPKTINDFIQITRTWEKVKDGKGDALVLKFTIENKTNSKIELGGLGFPLIFNNILQGQSLEAAHKENSFYDPYMGKNGGYLQVAKLDGKGPVLLVLPEGNTPFENYRPLLEDPTPRGLDFEGFYEWDVFSKSYSETLWKNATQWNTPTSYILQPKEKKSWGLRFVLVDSIKGIESKLIAEKRPVVVGFPGYVLPTDVNGSLFIHANSPIKSIEVFPKNAMALESSTIQNGWHKYNVKGNVYGRSRVTITYANGEVQTVHYKVILPESTTISNYGKFLNNKQWFEQNDPYFHRAPGYITYDNEEKKQVTQDSRAWIAGLSDEGGAGSWLGAAMKQMVSPDKEEIKKLEHFVDTTLWGQIQYGNGEHKFGVRKSLFFYAPDSFPKGTYDTSINFKTWSAWPVKEALDPGRSYNYPHVAAAYWSLYRLSRNHKNLVENHPWQWYLNQAYETVMNMVSQAPYYAQFGQMEGSVFFFILKDLKAEGLTNEANLLEAEMKKRAIHWDELPFPFESEMPWDSTGQEEVFIWSLYFGFLDKTDVTYSAILAYDPAIPHWAYNGNARRYWDFLYGGKLQRNERMIHHYGSELNAIPLLEYYKLHPSDLYTLRVGYGGVLGGIANIEQDGFAPAAFHSFPSTLKNDGISGDYGSGFFGYSVNTESYLVHDSTFGWLAFGGNLKKTKDEIAFVPTTAADNHLFIAPTKLDVLFLAGKVDHFTYSLKAKRVIVWLKKTDNYTPDAIMDWNGSYALVGNYTKRNDGKFIVPLSKEKLTQIILKIK